MNQNIERASPERALPEGVSPIETSPEGTSSVGTAPVGTGPGNEKPPYRPNRRPKSFAKADPLIAAYLTTEDIHAAIDVLRRQVKRKNARSARFLLKMAFFMKQP